MLRKPNLLKIAFSTTLLSTAAWGATYTVTSTADTDTPGTLRYAMNQVNASPSGSNTINFGTTGTITLLSGLPPIAIPSGDALSITGPGPSSLTIDGSGSYQAFFLYSGSLDLAGMTVNNANVTGTQGGNGTAVAGGGGGGGVAAGAGLFVNNGASASITNITFSNNIVVGGTGGFGETISIADGYGGGGSGAFGGGRGGADTPSGAGGGGGGFPGGNIGGNGGGNGRNGTLVGGGGGGGGSNTTTANTGGSGALAGNDGGTGGTTSSDPVAGTGSGGGGGVGVVTSAVAGANGGALGGGGGGGFPGGNGGFGAGAGGGGTLSGVGAAGGVGGIGGGGGGGGVNAAGGSTLLAGFGAGGAGSSSGTGGGGGGSGFGGAVFVHETGLLTIGNGVTFTSNSAAGGSGGMGVNNGQAGAGLGPSLFLTAGSTTTVDISGSLTFSDPIQSDSETTDASTGGLIVEGGGNLTLSGVNTFGPTLSIISSTVTLNNGASVTAEPILISGVLNTNGAAISNGIDGDALSSLNLGGALTVAVQADQLFTLSAPLNGVGPLVINGSVTGEQDVLSISSLTGGTIIRKGILGIADDNALGAPGVALTMGTSASDQPTLRMSPKATEAERKAALSINRSIAVNATQAKFDTDPSTIELTLGTTGSGGIFITGGGDLLVDELVSLGHTGTTGIDVGTTLTLMDGTSVAGPVVNQGLVVMRPDADVHFASSVENESFARFYTERALRVAAAPYGTATIGDNYTDAGTTEFDLDTTTSTNLDVAGTWAIEPGAVLMVNPTLSSTSVWTPGQRYSYPVGTAGSISGAYSAALATYPNRIRVILEYLSDPGIEAILTVVPFADIVPGGNTGATAACIDAYPVTAGSDMLTVQNALTVVSNSIPDLRAAITEMQPSLYGALALAQENNDILLRNAITHRLSEVYPLNCDEAWLNDHNGGLWVEGMGKYVNQDRQQHNNGFHASTGGVTLGSDYRIAKRTYLGGALAYTFTDVDWNASAGNAKINSYYGSMYGTWFNHRVFIDAAFIGAYNQYDEHRNISFTGIDRSAKSNHNGYQLAGSLGSGLLFTQGKSQVQPFYRLDYVYLHQNGFTEHGASSLNLKVRNTNSNYMRSDLGIKFEYCFDYTTVKLVPDLKLSWIWEHQFDDAHYRSSFVGQSCVFKTSGMHPTHNLFAPAVGLMVMSFGGDFTSSIHYEAEVGEKIWENRLYLHLGWNY